MNHSSIQNLSSPSEFVYGGSPHRMAASFTSEIFDVCSISSSQTSLSPGCDFEECASSNRCGGSVNTCTASSAAALSTALPPILSLDASLPREPTVVAPMAPVAPLMPVAPAVSIAPAAPVASAPYYGRRTANLGNTRTIPNLVRQPERKVNFVDTLVESATLIVEAIWPLSDAMQCQVSQSAKSPLKLRTFIEETLRRSRTSYSTLQVAMYYLILIKPHILSQSNSASQEHRDSSPSRALQCGRRMFLISLILASKYLQDRNYSAKAWSKISGLPISEINQNELAFLQAINWKLYIHESLFSRWTTFNLNFPPPPPGPGREKDAAALRWRDMILDLDVEITNVDLTVKPSPPAGVSMPSLLSMPRSNTLPTTVEMPTTCPTAPLRRFSYGHMSLPPMRMAAPAASPTPSAFSVASSAPCQRSMAMAMECANASFAVRNIDRYHMNSSPASQLSASMGPMRCSPLAAQSSISSSPESMISDDSRSTVSSVSYTPIHEAGTYPASLPCSLGPSRGPLRPVRMQTTSFSRSNSSSLPKIYENKAPGVFPLSDFGVPTVQSPVSFVEQEAARILQGFKSQTSAPSLRPKRSFSVMSYESCGSAGPANNSSLHGSSRDIWMTPESALESSKRMRYNQDMAPYALNYLMSQYPTASA
ncbi:G1/S-specific cyclin pas1 [Ceratocystis lukuohia]|uniref:G1/S-specific cyclin pas1 n=1 Tax=Ceratocystis lukuohia TaxID=2019550 RepID=A0ABR4MBS5_9PEZI